MEQLVVVWWFWLYFRSQLKLHNFKLLNFPWYIYMIQSQIFLSKQPSWMFSRAYIPKIETISLENIYWLLILSKVDDLCYSTSVRTSPRPRLVQGFFWNTLIWLLCRCEILEKVSSLKTGRNLFLRIHVRVRIWYEHKTWTRWITTSYLIYLYYTISL